MEAQGEESGVYLFIASAKVYGSQVDSVVYVGQTCSLKERLRHYVRTKKGYDVTRIEISRMFDKYGHHLKFSFAGAEPKKLDEIERTIYEVLRPEFNQKSPPGA
jgi:excinuclease UvrABC nuclease subunit